MDTSLQLVKQPAAEILPPERELAVLAKPHPFSTEIVRAVFPVGATLAEIVGPDAKCVRIEIAGEIVPPEWWARIRPKMGTAVLITRFPQGGNAKQIFRIIAFAALAVAIGIIAAPGGFFVATLGLGQTAAGVLAAVVGIGGMLLINALIPPQLPSQNLSASTSIDRLKSITGVSNQANPFGAIPCVLGVTRMFPPLAAVPFTELSGNDQYLRLLFDLGYGTVNVSDMKIGDSDLANFTDVQTDIGVNPSLYSNSILETAVSTEMDTDGSVVVKTSAPNADELSVDFLFPNGLVSIDSKGNSQFNTCDIRIEVSPTGANTWSSVTGGSQLTISNPSCFPTGSGPTGVFRVQNSARQAVRVGVRWSMLRAQYDVRLTRVTTTYGGTVAQAGQLNWAILRTITHTNPSTTGTTKIAMRIKATDQLNGTINQFNLIASQQIPAWNGTAWVTGDSDNPADLFRWILKDSPASARHVDASRINDTDLIAWRAECVTKEFTFSTCVDQPTTIFALLKEVCAAGRASFTVRDGQYTIVRDVSQSTPVQHFTPRNSWDFSGTRVFADVVHALRVQFINSEANYQQDEIVVYDAGYSADGSGGTTIATKFETFELRGCTNANGAWRLGRYHLAVARLRSNVYSFMCDIENLVCNRGDMVLFAHDVIGEGLAWGRIDNIVTASGQIAAFVLDERVTMDGTSSYSIRVRKNDNSTVLLALAAASAGDYTTVVLQVPQTIGTINSGDLFLFGITGNESMQMLVTKIEPAGDLSAKLTVVDYAPAVLTADSGTPPVFVSSVTGEPWNDAPPPPQIVIITSDQISSPPGDNGTTDPGVTVGVGAPPSRPIRTPSACVELGTPVEFYPDSTVTEEELDESQWIELDVPDGTEPLRMHPATLVSVFKRADELEAGDLVELANGAFFACDEPRAVVKQSRKVKRTVLPWRVYFARGVRIHNIKMRQDDGL